MNISSISKNNSANIALTSGKTYYYKVRLYKIVDGIKVYSGYITKIVSAKI
ncbi:hypothetical protein rsdtw13_37600 [Clostridium sp. TW13]|uniref:Uncharacterized protein n=1 Tax=Inconstantimicrobium mannanitabidum TaxID=1604901 RepID=A0ACB5RHE9_9CLOT|nr:hypothetical protein rsdtw13_37600 [Clostridium sp. TW13]